MDEEYFDSKRYRWYGICKDCKKFNTGYGLCHTCDSIIRDQTWESGDRRIDAFIKDTQITSVTYRLNIEWIPFDKLEDIEEIGKGGFSTVYSAIWKDGKRMVKYDEKNDVVASRKQDYKVALKKFTGTYDTSMNFLQEFRNYIECRINGNNVEIYGVTYDSKVMEYMMVCQYADEKDLRQYLSKNFISLTWKDKLNFLCIIADNLSEIHKAGYIHRNLHTGNILQINILQSIEENQSYIEPYISDLGLSFKIDELISNGKFYGVIPYVAPEIFLGQKHTKSSDVYSLGVIMSEMSTGKPPFENQMHDKDLQQKICYNKLQPEFASGTPDCYIQLAKKCMNDDKTKRPSAREVSIELEEWKTLLNKRSKELNEIKSAFLKADKISNT